VSLPSCVGLVNVGLDSVVSGYSPYDSQPNVVPLAMGGAVI
jgi:hypothetical protein